MPTPAPILEPLSTGDIIDRSVRIYRRNLRGLLATVSGPFVLGAGAWLMMTFGLNSLSYAETSGTPPIAAVFMIVIGFALNLAYAYLMVLAVAALSRAVGDHVMLGRPISFKASLDAIRGRIGTLTIAALLLGVAAMIIGAATVAVFFVALMLIGFLGIAIGAMHFPEWLAGLLVVVIMLAAFGAVLFVILPLMLSRIVFIPQVIMIEGCSVGDALTRSFSLGAKNWNRVLAILLFTYFSSLSLAGSVMVPILLVLWLTGYLAFDRESFDAVTGGVNQFSSFMVVPVWAISYTLLYFDSRVRKEGYDVDLLVRRLPPPPRPTPAPMPAYMPGWAQPASAFVAGRPAVKFTPEGRCLRCGQYNMFASSTCPSCGW